MLMEKMMHLGADVVLSGLIAEQKIADADITQYK